MTKLNEKEMKDIIDTSNAYKVAALNMLTSLHDFACEIFDGYHVDEPTIIVKYPEDDDKESVEHLVARISIYDTHENTLSLSECKKLKSNLIERLSIFKGAENVIDIQIELNEIEPNVVDVI